jgi:hypothetical protein
MAELAAALETHLVELQAGATETCGSDLRCTPRAGDRQQRQTEVRDARRPTGAEQASGDRIGQRQRRKARAIQKLIGRRPIAAFGNSDGDLEMLQWTAAGAGARFALLVHHNDAIREFTYDRTPSIGQLDKALDEANAKGWTVVDMKNETHLSFRVNGVRLLANAPEMESCSIQGSLWHCKILEFCNGTSPLRTHFKPLPLEHIENCFTRSRSRPPASDDETPLAQDRTAFAVRLQPFFQSCREAD